MACFLGTNGRCRHFQTVAGTRCVLDFVELPSILMEFFLRDHTVVSQFARHYKTGEHAPRRV